MKTVIMFLSFVVATPAMAQNFRFTRPDGHVVYYPQPWGNSVRVFDAYGNLRVVQPWDYRPQRVFYDNCGGNVWLSMGPVYYTAPNIYGVVPGSYSGHYYVPAW